MAGKGIRIGEGFFWVAIGVAVCFYAWMTGLGAVREPGPGFIAFVMGLCMAGIGVAMIAVRRASRTGRESRGEKDGGFRFAGSPQMIYATILLIAYAALIDRLGFVLTTFFVLWLLLFDRASKNWVTSVVVAGVTTGLSYVVFVRLLGLPFPGGILG